ncbi:putative baseplate assembly protein [Paraburkholderia sp. J7]|uniref:putative baseplate assembly protein n=1 Tax=Paraburkholderia sp. J7 TaxID=2805438 RepID=UPI002AB727CA|nr:putative baseplate assembly protein [Paraburkholderia sp. J7]
MKHAPTHDGASCDCCTGIEPAVPEPESNPPGMTSLQYRVGRYSTFYETMLARLGQITIDVPSANGTGTDTLRPLAGLTTRDPSDPSIALLDAWAVVADVLTFYQERTANEGYLDTALERRSVLELARLIGYRPRPGVAASVRLAFTVAAGFEGALPAGTRAQSVPGAGQLPQFYETSADLDTRAEWNTLQPRLTRAQVITPGATADAFKEGPPLPDSSGILVTGADVIDAVYLDGVSTHIRAGDALFFVFAPDTSATSPPLQYLRVAADVDEQQPFARTEVTLGLEVPAQRDAVRQLLLYIDKGSLLFPGSALCADVIEIVTRVARNLLDAGAVGLNGAVVSPRQLVAPAISRVALKRDIAVQRGFTRLAAWLNMLIQSMQWISIGTIGITPAALGAAGGVRKIKQLQGLPAGAPASALQTLGDIADALAKPVSVQFANALRLPRTVSATFGPQSDLAPRLLATLRPAAAGVYKGWAAAAMPGGRVDVYAARVKASLFAANWAGTPATRRGAHEDFETTYTQPTIENAWSATFPNLHQQPLPEVPLDAVYDQIKPGSWVAIRRPAAPGAASDAPVTTFHIVTGLRTSALSTGTGATQPSSGFAAKVTVLRLDPPWLSDLADRSGLATPPLLRETVVYAQSEAMTLTDEPLDVDVGARSIDLNGLYDGLKAGRWVIVSGQRTDIPHTTGVKTSELAMIAGIRQGIEAPGSADWPLASPPFVKIWYTSDADVYGDRLVVGQLPDAMVAQALNTQATEPPLFSGVELPRTLNQQFGDQVQLARGFYVNAYVPTAGERAGSFSSFDGLLVDPATQLPYPGGTLNWQKDGVFAWRIATQAPHTVLDLAIPLAYTYDRGTATVYGNVADATHGQSTGEVLGNGDATVDFADFALHQAPLTYVSAPSASGVTSTLNVRVNDLLWHEVDNLSQAAAQQRSYVTDESDDGVTSLTFGNGAHGARLPTGTANVKATYRYGLGQAGNVDAWSISQLATHPLGAQGVINPLPATGGADADSIGDARTNAPAAVMALDRLVSVRDYADFARAFAGVGKASALKLSDGTRELVHVTVAGAADTPIDPTSDAYANLLASLQRNGDPHLALALAVRRVRLLVIAAGVGLLTDYAWEDVAPAVRTALLDLFSFDARALGQSAYLSEAFAAAQRVPGVAWLNVTCFDSVAEDITATELAALGDTLALHPYVASSLAQPEPGAAPGQRADILPAELVILTPDIPDTLLLTQLDA